MRNLIFLSRVAVEISLTSPFLDNIGCDEVVALRMLIISPTIHTWLLTTESSRISRQNGFTIRPNHQPVEGAHYFFCHLSIWRRKISFNTFWSVLCLPCKTFFWHHPIYPVTGPSPALMESLHALSTSLHSLGLTHHPSQLTSIASSLLSLFIDKFTRDMPNGDTGRNVQMLNDANFLRCLALVWPSEVLETSSLDRLIAALQSEVRIRHYCDAIS